MTEKGTALLRNRLVLVAIVVAGAGAWGILVTGKRPAKPTASPEVAAKMKTVRIPVQGMTCAVCAANVKKALQSVDGVQEAEVDLARREARVRYDDGKVPSEQLVAAIHRLGYKAGTPVPEAPR